MPCVLGDIAFTSLRFNATGWAEGRLSKNKFAKQKGGFGWDERGDFEYPDRSRRTDAATPPLYIPPT